MLRKCPRDREGGVRRTDTNMNVKYSVPIIRWWPWTECRTAPVVKVIGLVLGIWTSVGFFNVLNPKNLHKCLLKQCWSQTLFPLFDFASKYIFSICSFRVCVNENLLYHMLREILNYQMPFFKAAFFPQMENCAWKSFHTLFFSAGHICYIWNSMDLDYYW